MKNLIKVSLIVICLFSSFISFSQGENERSPLLPKAGDFGVSLLVDGLIDNVQLNSFSTTYGQNILFGKYYYTDDLVVRFGFGLDVNSASRTTADSVGLTLVKTDSSVNNFVLNFSGGVEKHFNSTKRLDPYVFAQLDITFVGKTNAEINSSTESAAGISRTERTIKQDGGIGFGITGGGGFNYFLAERFSVGAEVAFQIQYVSEGGTISDNIVNTPINGQASTIVNSREDQINGTIIGVQPNAMINLSYFF